jgi:hypothetical protein
VVSVAASIATQRMPMLLVVSATSMVNMKSWNMLLYSRKRAEVSLPSSRSFFM